MNNLFINQNNISLIWDILSENPHFVKFSDNKRDVIFNALKEDMKSILRRVEAPLLIPEMSSPFVILVIGVNGAGKTTTIGKIAHFLKEQHKKILLAAGDTFRAAAIEQLQVWGDRNDVPVIAQAAGAVCLREQLIFRIHVAERPAAAPSAH